MSISCIMATILCDACGTKFQVEIDPAEKPPAGWCAWDLAENAVRGGTSAEGTGSTSVQDGEMLCRLCTKERDGKAEEDEP